MCEFTHLYPSETQNRRQNCLCEPGFKKLQILISHFSDNPGSYGADFQSERLGTHSVMITLDGLPVPGSPIEVVLGKPALSLVNGSPPATSTRSVRSNPRKPGELWDVHGVAIDNDGKIVVTDSKCHRIQVIYTDNSIF